MLRHLSIATAALVMFTATQSAHADAIYCAFIGLKQGPIAGDGGPGGDPTQIPVLALSEEVFTPTDPTSGLPTGQRQHKPITILKSLDRASPRLFIAAITHENLSSVKCTFYRTRIGGGITSLTPYFKLTLTNAFITDLKIAGDGGNAGVEHETASLNYQRIELTDLVSNTTATDDW